MRAKRTDATHASFSKALRQCGWEVKDTHIVPNFVDAVVNRHGVVRLVEFKTGKGTLTASQEQMLADGWPFVVLRDIDDCAALR